MRFFILFLFSCVSVYAQSIHGFVTELETKEKLSGVSVYCLESKKGDITNKYGFYSLNLPNQIDSFTIVFSMIGYEPIRFKIKDSKSELNIELKDQIINLNDVVITSNENKINETARMSIQTLPIKQIQELPALLGEKDLLKTLQLMPGFQRGNDGNGIIFVRGGASDQNLLLLDEAPVYNLFHAGGFFSVFNSNALKRFEASKGAFSARYGGRLSSVIDVQTKDGNKQKTSGSLGIGLLSSNLLLEGPIQKNKSSFLFSGRMSYWDKIYSAFRPAGKDNISFGLYDYIAKFHFILSSKDQLYISNYFGRDSFVWARDRPQYFSNQTRFQKKYDFGFNWGNNTGTIRWNRVFSQKMFANTTVLFSKYDFRYQNNILFSDSKSKIDDLNENAYVAKIQDIGIKTDIDYYHKNHHVLFGGGFTRHQFVPENIKLYRELNMFRKDTIVNIPANEYFIYVEDEYHPIQNILLNIGLRQSVFEVENKKYSFFEPRLGAAYKFGKGWAAKIGYARMNQFVHLASNNGVGFPFDVWIPTTNQVKPQQADQISAGIAKDFKEKNYEFSAEIYYKTMSNLPALKEGSAFLSGNTLDIFQSSLATVGESWENKIVQGNGKAYGFETLLQRKKGALNGWISYTYSKVINQFKELNNGLSFLPRFDRRHNASLVGIYQIRPNLTLSGTWSIASGQRITVPTSSYNIVNPNLWYNNANLVGNTVYEYKEYGNFKTPAYHRLDLNVQFNRKKNKNKLRTWELGVFNVYNRKNPFFYSFSETSPSSFTKTNIFPIIPSISYNIKF